MALRLRMIHGSHHLTRQQIERVTYQVGVAIFPGVAAQLNSLIKHSHSLIPIGPLPTNHPRTR